MTRTYLILCGEAAADSPQGSGKNVGPTLVKLRNVDPDDEVNLHISEISRLLFTDIPPQWIDLIEIAAYVYVADQVCGRGGPGVENMGANWRRSLRFEIPVRRLDLWRQSNVALALRDVLSFLSEDEYEFAFRQYAKPPPLEQYLNFATADEATRPERVVLFSGGLDSLGGAVQEVVVGGQPVVFVTHAPSTKLAGRIEILRNMIDVRAKGPKPLHVSVSINKKEWLGREFTQRSRSFLFASLAGAIARMHNINAVRFYENGTVSLNLPISRQVVGSKATRTTHPRVLAGFQKLFSLVSEQDFKVSNGFLWKTKGQVVQSILDADCSDMIRWSSSCMHTREISIKVPHCGKCSQCIDRRFAVLAAGAGVHEPADTYGVDLLTDARDKGEPRTMLASYVQTARQIARMSEVDFFKRFGEIARILRYLDGRADENAHKIFKLYQQHGQEVADAVTAGVKANADNLFFGSLPPSCLLRLVSDQGASAGHSVKAPNSSPIPAYTFRPYGNGWLLRFAGRDEVPIPASRGCLYLWELLRFPRKVWHVSDLLIAVRGDRARVPLGDAGEELDGETKRSYGIRLGEIDEEIEEARDNQDHAAQDRLFAEREDLLSAFKSAGFKKIPKRSHSDVDRVRKAVSAALNRAIATIRKYQPHAADHFKASISLGKTVCYSPSEDLPWSF